MTDSTQDKALQKKLVGAAVLIALAVIFLPMLFDGKKDETPVSMQIEIPPKPTFDIPNRLEREPASSPNVVAQAPEPPVQTIEITTDEPPVAPPPAERTAPVEQKTVSEPPAPSKPVEQPKPKKDDKPPARKPEPKKAEKPKPQQPTRTTKSPAGGGAGYVVQVGSFSQKTNAEALTRKLQAGGFPAFVESTKAGGKSIYRVKVGPRPTREAADDLRQRLIDKQRLEGIIVSHH